MPVFSLRWSLPPTLGCIPKQPDSEEARCRRVQRRYGPDTRSGYGHDQEDFGAGARLSIGFLYTTFPAGHLVGGFGAGLFPLHSPLLRESLLVSFPPLTDMLKFSGYSRLIRGRSVFCANAERRAQPDILSAASRTESAAKGEPPSLFATRDGGRLARQAGPSSPVCAPLSSFVLRGERTVEAVVSRRTRESVRPYAPRSVKAVSAYCRRLLATASMRSPTRLPCASEDWEAITRSPTLGQARLRE